MKTLNNLLLFAYRLSLLAALGFIAFTLHEGREDIASINRLGVQVKGDVSGSVKVAGGAVRVVGPVEVIGSDFPLVVQMNKPVEVEVTNPVEVYNRFPIDVKVDDTFPISVRAR